MWRVRERATFVELRRHGRRFRSGPLAVTFVARPDDDPSAPPQVAFAIGRQVGSAVTRNRVRRRLRSVLRELAGGQSPILRQGAYLIRALPESATLTQEELKGHVVLALKAVYASADPGMKSS